MTVKFFPLFFRKSCQMSPVGVQLIYALSPLIMAAFSGVATPVSLRVGRAQTMVALKVVGVGLLVAMAVLSICWLDVGSIGGKASGPMPPVSTAQVVTVVAIYLVRTSLMNCTYPIEESILMDFVPSDTRARWKALDSIGMFGWCGSAAVGGVLADKFGYSFTFLITAAVQGVAVLIQASLIFIVPRSERAGSAATPAAAQPFVEPLVADTAAAAATEGTIQ
jgi:MFS family permease